MLVWGILVKSIFFSVLVFIRGDGREKYGKEHNISKFGMSLYWYEWMGWQELVMCKTPRASLDRQGMVGEGGGKAGWVKGFEGGGMQNSVTSLTIQVQGKDKDIDGATWVISQILKNVSK